jgi:hypothetical protein
MASSPEPSERALLDGLARGHASLRSHARAARVLADSTTSEAETRASAAHLVDGLTQALAAHERDEELLLARLAEVAPELMGTLDVAEEQHALLLEIVESLTPMWRALRASVDVAATRAHLGGALERESRRLEAVLDLHLLLEETVIFPHLPRLSLAARPARHARRAPRTSLGQA